MLLLTARAGQSQRNPVSFFALSPQPLQYSLKNKTSRLQCAVSTASNPCIFLQLRVSALHTALLIKNGPLYACPDCVAYLQVYKEEHSGKRYPKTIPFWLAHPYVHYHSKSSAQEPTLE